MKSQGRHYYMLSIMTYFTLSFWPGIFCFTRFTSWHLLHFISMALCICLFCTSWLLWCNLMRTLYCLSFSDNILPPSSVSVVLGDYKLFTGVLIFSMFLLWNDVFVVYHFPICVLRCTTFLSVCWKLGQSYFHPPHPLICWQQWPLIAPSFTPFFLKIMGYW